MNHGQEGHEGEYLEGHNKIMVVLQRFDERLEESDVSDELLTELRAFWIAGYMGTQMCFDSFYKRHDTCQPEGIRNMHASATAFQDHLEKWLDFYDAQHLSDIAGSAIAANVSLIFCVAFDYEISATPQAVHEARTCVPSLRERWPHVTKGTEIHLAEQGKGCFFRAACITITLSWILTL